MEDRRDEDRRKSELGSQIERLKSEVLMVESDSAPAVESELAPDELAPDREERKSPLHMWAHLYQRVMKEEELRHLVPVQKTEAGLYLMMKKSPGLRTHRLVDRGL